MAGYAFAKYRFRGRNVLFAVLIATMFLPPIVTLIPLYRIVAQIGLDGRLIGVIVPNLANAFGIFLMRQFIQGVPDDLIDAARIDGAGELRILSDRRAARRAGDRRARAVRLRLPLEQLPVAADRAQRPGERVPDRHQPQPPAQLQPPAQNTDLVMAGATLAVLPPLAVFVFLQRFFVRTIARSGLTG